MDTQTKLDRMPQNHLDMRVHLERYNPMIPNAKPINTTYPIATTQWQEVIRETYFSTNSTLMAVYKNIKMRVTVEFIPSLNS